MKKLLFTFLLLSQYILVFSQFYDNFSYKSCNGDCCKLEIYLLGLLDHKTDMSNVESILFTESTVSQNRIWKFKPHYNFSPSTSNYTKLYVMSDIKDISYNINSYFSKTGSLSGSTDNIRLQLDEDRVVKSYKKFVVLR